MFTDSAILRVRGGHGGRGSASFRAQPFEPHGGPDGGDGGAGGDVVLRAGRDLYDLTPLLRRPRLRAADGQAGAGARKEGRRAPDLVVDVPVGTIVRDAATGEVLGDLSGEGETLVAARGGAGGGGNMHRASSVNRTPTAAGPGEPGEARELRLEFRIPADVALVGPPNSGKSTLLSALTAARPKIAGYPHTTTEPQLGVMFAGDRRPLTLLELPGKHLRQLERARAVALVLDGREPGELKSWRPKLGARPVLPVWAKSDLVPGPHRRAGAWVSAETGVGVEELRQRLLALADSAPPVRPVQPSPRRIRLEPAAAGSEVRVLRRDWGLEVEGARVDRLLDRYDLDTPAGFDRFQVALERMGVNAALEEAGAVPGETVRIGDAEFEYQPG